MILPLLALVFGPALAQDPVPPSGNYVAVVLGLSSYKNLPDEVELDFARSDAAIVAKTLQEKARFSHVILMTDGEATKTAVQDRLRTEVAQLVGPNDVFVLYLVGHGIGADLDLPTFLAHDSTLENGQEDGLELEAFARDLQTWTPAGNMLVVTDVIHRNQLDGIYFYGPASNQWPAMKAGTMVLSSSQAESPSKDGAFGTVFADAMAGAADKNGDSHVTAQELETYLVNRMSPVGQIPVAAGDYEPQMVLASGVASGTMSDGTQTGAPVPEAEPEYPDIDIWSAKFVFREGDSQSVQCRSEDVRACAPSCYVRNFKAGPCDLQAVVDGVHMSGRVIVLWPGKYDCGRKAGDLVCTPPKTEVTRRPWDDEAG